MRITGDQVSSWNVVEQRGARRKQEERQQQQQQQQQQQLSTPPRPTDRSSGRSSGVKDRAHPGKDSPGSAGQDTPPRLVHNNNRGSRGGARAARRRDAMRGYTTPAQPAQQPQQQQGPQSPPQPQVKPHTPPDRPTKQPEQPSPCTPKNSTGPPGRNVPSVAPSFVAHGWLYPAGLNRKQRRAAMFGHDNAEVQQLEARYVGEHVPDGPITDDAVAAALQEQQQQSEGDDEAPPSLGVPSDDEGEDEDAPEEEHYSASAPIMESRYAAQQVCAQGERSSTPGATASADTEAERRSASVAPLTPKAPPPPPGQQEQQSDSASDDADLQPIIGVGDRVVVSRRQGQQQVGTVQYVGYPDFKGRGPGFEGEWFGVALDAPEGNHDGEIDGVRYFTALPNHGVFVRADKLFRFGDPAPLLPTDLLTMDEVHMHQEQQLYSAQQHCVPQLGLQMQPAQQFAPQVGQAYAVRVSPSGALEQCAQLTNGGWVCQQQQPSPQHQQQQVHIMQGPIVQQSMTRVIKVIRCSTQQQGPQLCPVGPQIQLVPQPVQQSATVLLNGVPQERAAQSVESSQRS
eukprot:TRINITY_DN6960_c0_g1_i2.p1 TRINITY_DN6960_c0_g1~~TRINITY_DN6960_c0_g1_i2.p1  ORF type:complete len:570 (+),score=231.28 TRINITY_DN6960_c0_g1_i2:201-1910(+)